MLRGVKVNTVCSELSMIRNDVRVSADCRIALRCGWMRTVLGAVEILHY